MVRMYRAALALRGTIKVESKEIEMGWTSGGVQPKEAARLVCSAMVSLNIESARFESGVSFLLLILSTRCESMAILSFGGACVPSAPAGIAAARNRSGRER